MSQLPIGCAAANAQMEGRFWDVKLLEKNGVERRIVVLPGVDDAEIDLLMFPKRLFQCRHFYKIGACTHNRQNLQIHCLILDKGFIYNV